MAETKWKVFNSNLEICKDKVVDAQLDGVALTKGPRRP